VRCPCCSLCVWPTEQDAVQTCPVQDKAVVLHVQATLEELRQLHAPPRDVTQQERQMQPQQRGRQQEAAAAAEEQEKPHYGLGANQQEHGHSDPYAAPHPALDYSNGLALAGAGLRSRAQTRCTDTMAISATNITVAEGRNQKRAVLEKERSDDRHDGAPPQLWQQQPQHEEGATKELDGLQEDEGWQVAKPRKRQKWCWWGNRCMRGDGCHYKQDKHLPNRWDDACRHQRNSAKKWDDEQKCRRNQHTASGKIQCLVRRWLTKRVDPHTPPDADDAATVATVAVEAEENDANTSNEDRRQPQEKQQEAAGHGARDDKLLDAAIAQANAERDAQSHEVEEAAKRWKEQAEKRDQVVPQDERTVGMTCNTGHFLCYTKKRGRCVECGRRLLKNVSAVGCTGYCRDFVLCTLCLKKGCGEDALGRLTWLRGNFLRSPRARSFVWKWVEWWPCLLEWAQPSRCCWPEGPVV